MRSTLLVSALAALALAAPRPQDIEFDLVDAAPDADPVTPPIGGGAQSSVSIQPAAVATNLGGAAVTDVASAAATSAIAATDSKRDFLEVADSLKKRDGDCLTQPLGSGPTITSPNDDDNSFLAYSGFSSTANTAAVASNVPEGYSLAFQNLQGSSQTVSYLGYKTLTSYDPVQCASFCDQQDGCVAFNIYFERDPTVDPNSSSCPNPPSTTNIKCVRWGVQVTAATATNNGQWRDSFHVVIAGSNGYNKNAAPPAQSGFTGPVELGGAINAPLDPVTQQNTYMGYKFFSFSQVQTFANGVTACTAACTAQTGYNCRHPPSTGKPSVCNQVVVYVLSDENQPQGIYCSMYTEEWAPEYATNYGQYRGSDYWSVSQVYAYTANSYTYSPICAVGGCPNNSFQGGNCGGWGAGTC